MGKLYDVVATIGSYEKAGEKKYINRNVGSVIETQHGMALKLDACFSPAGCQVAEDGSVWLKLFEPKENRAPDAAQQAYNKGAAKPQTQQQPAVFDDSFDDSIPF